MAGVALRFKGEILLETPGMLVKFIIIIVIAVVIIVVTLTQIFPARNKI